MAGFSKALDAILSGSMAKRPSGLNKWVYLDREQNRLCHYSERYGNMEWLVTQHDLLANDWEIK